MMKGVPFLKVPLYLFICIRFQIAFGYAYIYPSFISHRHYSSSCLSATLETKLIAENDIEDSFLKRFEESIPYSQEWARDFGLENESGVAFHALFSAVRSSNALGLRGRPFHVKNKQISDVMDETTIDGCKNSFDGFFSFEDLATAVQDDFLDASRGTTDNRKGWKVAPVSTPRGSSFQDARMTMDQVKVALDKGTVIFNTAGSHIPKLAGSALACTDASSLPCASNLYVTAAGKRTSAPPHTDRQDVIIVQTQGKKHWRVFTPPDQSLNPQEDLFARGKGDDDMPLYSLSESFGCIKLLDITLEAGDVLFVPAGFPHTTDTNFDSVTDQSETASIHLTFNFDTHVWLLDYLSIRRFALLRAGVSDVFLGQEQEETRYTGDINNIAKELRYDLVEMAPFGFLEENKDELVQSVTTKLEEISRGVDEDTYKAVPSSTWKETVEAVRKFGMEVLSIHRDIYLAAMEEGRLRKAEEEMTAHLSSEALARANALTPEKIQRLSLFRVQKYFEKVDESKKTLTDWSLSGSLLTSPHNGPIKENASVLPDDWAFTFPLNVGDEVEADLGGAFFEATVTSITSNGYDVKFFDGDAMSGMDRSMIKLLTPPVVSKASSDKDQEEPPPGLTKKELKKWLKKQEKKSRKAKGF